MTRFNAAKFVRGWMLNSLAVWFLFIPLVIASLMIGSGIIQLSASLFGEAFILTQFMHVAGLFILPGAIIAWCMADAQHEQLNHLPGWNFSGWQTVSIAGGIAGSLLVYGAFMLMRHSSEQTLWMLVMPLFMAGMGLSQTIILARYSRQAWLWVLANGVSGLIFSGVLFLNPPAAGLPGPVAMIGLWVIATLCQSALTAYVMLWLYDERAYDPDEDLAPVTVPIRSDD